MEHSLEGWDITRFDEVDWVPWGSGGNARAKILGIADGFHIALVEADAGYRGDPHVHTHPELFYLVEGTFRHQGKEMASGDAYAAAPGSSHTDFATDSGATYVTIFKL